MVLAFSRPIVSTCWKWQWEIRIQGTYKEGSFSFSVQCLSHSFSFVRTYFKKCISGLFKALEFQDVCDVRLWLTSIINHNYKEGIRMGPSISWRDGFSPSPSNVRSCTLLLIIKISKYQNIRILSFPQTQIRKLKHPTESQQNNILNSLQTFCLARSHCLLTPSRPVVSTFWKWSRQNLISRNV